MPQLDEQTISFAGEQFIAMVVLVGICMFIHGFSMLPILEGARRFSHWAEKRVPILADSFTLVLAAVLIIMVHICEVIVWGMFFYSVGAFKDIPDSVYFSLLQYVTVGSDMDLPFRWRYLAGAIAMVGLLTFAWSTSTLLTLVNGVQLRRIEKAAQKRSGKKG